MSGAGAARPAWSEAFARESLAALHPGGRIGKRLMRVSALMHHGEACPVVSEHTPMRDVIYEMSRKKLGMTCVVDGERILGIITDGDLRRHMERGEPVLELTAGAIMTRQPITISRSTLAVEALRVMEERKITAVIVVQDDPALLAGVVQLHDLWRTEMI